MPRAQLPARISAEALAPIVERPTMQQALETGYTAFQQAVLAARQARNLTVPVGALDADLVQRMVAAGLEPSTAPIVARDVEVLHALRDTKHASVS